MTINNLASFTAKSLILLLTMAHQIPKAQSEIWNQFACQIYVSNVFDSRNFGPDEKGCIENVVTELVEANGYSNEWHDNFFIELHSNQDWTSSNLLGTFLISKISVSIENGTFKCVQSCVHDEKSSDPSSMIVSPIKGKN